MGGRIIIFLKNEDNDNSNISLNHFYEFQAQENEFDVHKSCQLSKSIRALDIVSSNDDNIDILSSNYRNIKYDRIQTNSKEYIYDTTEDSSYISCEVLIPRIKMINYKKKHFTKREYKHAHCFEINSVMSNKFNKNNFISSDDYKILLWDINFNKEVYNIVNIDDISNDEDNPEKITVSKLSNYNPYLLAFGTDFGNLFLCDLRVSSNVISNSLKFNDETSPFIKTIFSKYLTKVHDLDFINGKNEYSLVSRHYLSLNTWDSRNLKAPVNRIMLYEPLINKLSYLYQKNFMNDKFTISIDNKGQKVVTGGYNNLVHVIDLDQMLNTQILIDESDQMKNSNAIRKINSKGSCFYKKDDPTSQNLNFDKKILNQSFSSNEYILISALNCIYTFTGKIKL